jgi:hypothetical protein
VGQQGVEGEGANCGVSVASERTGDGVWVATPTWGGGVRDKSRGVCQGQGQGKGRSRW